MKLWSHGAASKIAATATALAVTGAFGVGAYALTQDGAVFDPSGFTSAYGKGADDSQKGYQATPESADAAANRHNDASSNNDRSAEESPSKDAFSELPNNGKGTTAVSVDANAKPGTSTVVDDPNAGGSDNGSGNGGGNPTGPVVDNGGDGNGNGGDNGSGGDNDSGGGSGSGDNGGSATPSNPGGNGAATPSRPDTPTAPDTPGGSQTPPKTDDNSPDVDVRDDQNPTFSEKPDAGIQFGAHVTAVNDSLTNLTDADVNPNRVSISASTDADARLKLFVGQKASAWDLFCSLNTFFMTSDNNQYVWRCERGEFDSYSKYFKIISIATADGRVLPLEEDKTVEIPSGKFYINVSYSCGPNCTTKYKSVEYEACTFYAYVIDPYSNPEANPKILGTHADDTFDLAAYNDAVFKNNGLIDENGLLKMLIPGWRESNGGNVADSCSVSSLSGRHVFEPQPFVEYDTSTYNVKLKGFYLPSLSGGTALGHSYVRLQTMTSLNGGRSVGDLEIPEGVQAIDIESNADASWAQPSPEIPDMLVDGALKLPSTVRVVNLESGNLAVEGAFEVDPANSWYASTDEGILTNKAGDEYLGIPTSTTELYVPSDVSRIELSPRNDALKTINLDEFWWNLPEIEAGGLHGCNIIVDEDQLNDALTKYEDLLTAKSGNFVCVAGEEDVRYNAADGMTISNGDLVKAENAGISTLRLEGVSFVRSGSFSGNTDVTTLVLDESASCGFEPGCFEGSEVRYIVCSDDKQAAAVKTSLGSMADSIEVVTSQRDEEGSVFFTADDEDSERVVLLDAADDMVRFDGCVKTSGRSATKVTEIAPAAFADSQSLHWVILPEETKEIGAKAFKNCASLQGVFIASTDTITIEGNAFLGCDSLLYVASRAANPTLDGNLGTSGNLWCLRDNLDAYAGSDFNVIDNPYLYEKTIVGDFSIVNQPDGSPILYASDGLNDGFENWLCIKAGTDLSGDVVLPDSTVEIWKGAFENTSNVSSINLSELPLLAIHERAFSGSGMSGDLTLGTEDRTLAIDSYAFSETPNITSLHTRSARLTIGTFAFAGCSSLENVSLSCSGAVDLGGELFDSCSQLTKVTFDFDEIPSLTRVGALTPYYFNYDWEETGVPQGVFQLSCDPDSQEALIEKYVDAWFYSLVGCSSYAEFEKLIISNCSSGNPSDEEIYSEARKEALEVENKVRRLFGLNLLTESSVDFPQPTSAVVSGMTFSVKEGVAKLINVSSSVDFADLSMLKEIYGWNEVVIKAGAFDGCSALRKVRISDDVDEVESGAFEGLGDDATIEFDGDDLPELVGGSVDAPFVFSSSAIKLELSDQPPAKDEPSLREKCLREWPAEMLGYDVDELAPNSVRSWLYLVADPFNASYEEAQAAAAEIDGLLLAQENVLRGYMDGMSAIGSGEDLTFSCWREYKWIYSMVWFDAADEDSEVKTDAGDGKPEEPAGNDGAGIDGVPSTKEDVEASGVDETDADDSGDRGDEIAPSEPSTPEAPAEPEDAAIE